MRSGSSGSMGVRVQCAPLFERKTSAIIVLLSTTCPDRTDTERNKMAAGRDNPDINAKDLDLCYPVGSERPNIKSPDDMTTGKHKPVIPDILSSRADVLPGCGTFTDLDLPASFPGFLDHDDGVEFRRNNITGMTRANWSRITGA